LITEIRVKGFEKINQLLNEKTRIKEQLESNVYELENELNEVTEVGKIIDKSNSFLSQEAKQVSFQSTRLNLEQDYMDEEIPNFKREIESVL